LLAPLTEGSELGGYVIEALEDAHGMRVVLAREGARVFLEVDARDDAFAAAVRTERLAISYRGADAVRPIAASEGRRLAGLLAAHVAPREAAVLATLADEAAMAQSATDAQVRVREVLVRRALEPAGEGASRYETITPYVGCLVGCTFCYAQERLHRTRALFGLAPAPWGSWVDARTNLVEVLRAELASDRAPLPVKLCPIVSDPYHALERRLRLTRGVIEALAYDARREVLVLTRSALVRDDLALLSRARAHLGVSLPSVRPEIHAALEPRSASFEERLAVLKDARALGVRTFVIAQPILDEDVVPLADAVAEVTSSAQIDVLRGTYGATEAFRDPALAGVASESAQRELALRLRAALDTRGVPVWRGELPPDIAPAV
jgi:DNA repair photolyase